MEQPASCGTSINTHTPQCKKVLFQPGARNEKKLQLHFTSQNFSRAALLTSTDHYCALDVVVTGARKKNQNTHPVVVVAGDPVAFSTRVRDSQIFITTFRSRSLPGLVGHCHFCRSVRRTVVVTHTPHFSSRRRPDFPDANSSPNSNPRQNENGYALAKQLLERNFCDNRRKNQLRVHWV